MATHSRKTGFPEFFADAKSAESARRQFIEAPLEAARQSALGPALELAKMLSLLPDAFVASQRRELKRIKDSAEKNDPRVAALEASIEDADALRTMARRGEVRAQRSLVALASNNEIFHGFVSDSDLNPLKGLTVRIASGREGSAKELSETTDAEGYFRIPLSKRSFTQRESEAEAVNMTPERIAELFASREKERSAEGQQNAEGKGSRVEILMEGKLLHEDPVPIGLDDGSVYREYVISDKEPSSASDFREFIARQGGEPAGAPVDSKDGATKSSPASSDRASAASPPVRRSAKKRTARGAIKPAPKK